MAVVVEVAYQRNVNTEVADPSRDFWNCSCSLVVVDSYADELGSRICEISNLSRRRYRVGGVGVRHRLNDDRVATTNGHIADHYRYCFSAIAERHRYLVELQSKANSAD